MTNDYIEKRKEYLESETTELYCRIEYIVKSNENGLQKAKDLFYLSELVFKMERELEEINSIYKF